MSNDYVIVTDSTANLPEDMIEKYGLEILSLNYYVDGEEYKGYIKGQKTDLAHFYSSRFTGGGTRRRASGKICY